MINLQDYLFNDVILTDIDNKQWKGHVFSFHDADDNEDNENSITLKIPDNKNLQISCSNFMFFSLCNGIG